MDLKEIKSEVSRVARIENATKCQDEVRSLDRKANAPSIKRKLRGHYHYFYVVKIEYRSEVKGGRESVTEKLGRCKKEIFDENKKEISRSQKEGNKEELTKWLEQY